MPGYRWLVFVIPPIRRWLVGDNPAVPELPDDGDERRSLFLLWGAGVASLYVRHKLRLLSLPVLSLAAGILLNRPPNRRNRVRSLERLCPRSVAEPLRDNLLHKDRNHYTGSRRF